MQNIDKTQSFTAQLFVDNKPVAVSRKIMQKMLEAPDIPEEWAEVLRRKLVHSANLLSYGEGVTPDTFLFVYHDDVYTIKIADDSGKFINTASMEGELRNLTVFEGDDPTYFRIINRTGENSKLDDLPDEFNKIRLHTGPQRREVHTYGEAPNFPVLTDYEDRGGRLVFFELKIIKRNVSM
ncbi:hypothetical protein [Pseudomonas sp. ANT_H12B]|uniref:hypothetical protein n=1 Tax=Pseudomonas sp. ANT_H12B TaxID=2597348 RepID=UPI0011F0713D|nr:hypothetical protein [Pseudomonas sp. ANT_H12B]KAA0969953.1 hypothetical protein FQ185_16950 [Pseudomonas sp. ANT_H12B]